ncbi:hypothetical protein [Natronosalvus rutilus]|uniref:Uncharacterized protein n=1 Tax=Natronosalvus rutilus TaxID=2953753 RepID=A0A9E7SVM9_9EURY|nr:hypothetical protein [Natronosalvus rutilus]UTF54655.1 hypothetical protein NGM29_05110 [Natronosalvus rutilus]
MADAQPIQWRRDATTSRAVRALWAFGVGTFFAVISIVAVWRVFDLLGQAGTTILSTTVAGTGFDLTSAQAVLVAALLGLAASILALAASAHTQAHLERLSAGLPLPVSTSDERGLQRAMDAALGTLAMVGVVGALMFAGRLVSQGDLLAVGAGPFTFLAAFSLPLALIALVGSSFLRSVGTIDADEGVIYLHDPEERIALEHLEDASVRTVGDTAIVTLEYATPGGQYVPGPRRLVVPPVVARELEGLVGRSQ